MTQKKRTQEEIDAKEYLQSCQIVMLGERPRDLGEVADTLPHYQEGSIVDKEQWLYKTGRKKAEEFDFEWPLPSEFPTPMQRLAEMKHANYDRI